MIKKIFLTSILCLIGFLWASGLDSWIRINQLGYLPDAQKKAVFISEAPIQLNEFSIFDALTSEKMLDLKTVKPFGKFETYKSSYILDFSSFKLQGSFYIKAGHYYSPTIYINKNIYNGSADFLLNYIRQQRCGYNPVLKDLCHQFDGFVVNVEKPKEDPKSKQTTLFATKGAVRNQQSSIEYDDKDPHFVDLTGGWHNASDYVKYGATSAVATFQMLFAYKMDPLAYADNYDALGRKRSNGIPDVLDEAKWGLDWLLKMNPEKDILYFQVADDRDKSLGVLPAQDTVDYGWGGSKERPVYKATGKPDGLFVNKNRTTGMASIAGKYASAYALGAAMLSDYYPVFADSLATKAVEAYELGKKFPGVCQSVPALKSKYFEENDWTDDMELAAMQLYYISYESKYMDEAAAYARMQPVSPWIFSKTAKYYQWYPFTNYGHFLLANLEQPNLRKEFIQNILTNLQRAELHRNENPFGVGIPLIMGSNNYASSLVSQCNLYRRFTGDSTFVDMEMSLNDWLFGCNPWGISMVIGLPETANAPKEPFSALSSSFQIPINGGLISGPVNNDVYRNQIDIQLSKADVYAQFQTNWAVYHDDEVDYLTNEPTLDATASLLYFLSSKQFDGAARRERDSNQYYKSALVRTNKAKKQISLVFSANQFADGKADILHALDKLDAKASFFLTGDFLRNRHYKKIVEEILAKGHYVGAHSDKYLQYCDVKNRETLLLTKEEFKADLKRNYDELARFGVTKQEAPFFLPPYGLSNDSISRWCKEFGVVLVNNTAGTISSADITIPEMRENYYSSLEINNQIMTLEAKEGLNGYILLFHLGTDIRRADKFYERIYKLLSDLKKKGYEFSDLHESSNLLTKYKKPEKKKRKNN